MSKIRVVVWNENVPGKNHEEVIKIYPDGIHGAIAGFLKEEFEVRTATLDEPSHGLTDDVLNNTDVLIWWGHLAHDKVSDEIVEKIYSRVLDGMGLILLHSSHMSKLFRKITGTRCMLRWRENNERERLWVVAPNHPITKGLPSCIEIPKEETYGEYFQIPEPDELVFIAWFEGGEVFRAGLCYKRERGRIFYFQPGHETYPNYYMPEIQLIIKNAVKWSAPTGGPDIKIGHFPEPLEKIAK